MQYHIVSIFPNIFDSFLSTSLIAKAREKQTIRVHLTNPRDFCANAHQQIDDMPYGGGTGMLMKAQPIINALKAIENNIGKDSMEKTKIILLGPSKEVFTQSIAHELVASYEHLILICGRYEGIDHRVELWCEQQFGAHFSKLSLGTFVTLGGEVPAMTIIEATARLIPGVIKEEMSWQDESYRPEKGGSNLEYPQYTRPDNIEGLEVPNILLSGHHKRIQEWRDSQCMNSEGV